jgi:hypothetical protein
MRIGAKLGFPDINNLANAVDFIEKSPCMSI